MLFRSLKELAKQYRRYGFWKVRMLHRYPATIRWRQAIPPLFVASIFLLGILSIFIPFTRIILGVELGIYLLIVLFIGLQTVIRNNDLCFLLMPCAIITMHLSWGCGFISSLFAYVEGIKSINEKQYQWPQAFMANNG